MNTINNELYFDVGNNNYLSNMYNNVKFQYCGKEQRKAGHAFHSEEHEDYVICVIVSGNGILTYDEQSGKLDQGDAFLVCPGEKYIYTPLSQSLSTRVWLVFSGKGIEVLLGQMGFSRENRIVNLSSTSNIETMIDEILCSKEMSVIDELKRQSSFYSILASLIKFSQGKIEVKEEKIESLYVKKAIELIETNYSKKLKVQDIANQIGINRSYLTNLFKKTIGTSPQNYLIDCRLEKSAQLLRETQNSMVDIALEVGYSDSLAYSKAFKQKYGMSPSEYRKKSILKIVE